MKKILLIEDDKVMRENIAELLGLTGYHVWVAGNGKEGIKKAKELLPDLILCDIVMPDLDGYSVLYTLSRFPATAVIPFIFLSGKAENASVRKGMEMGADDYLVKPFEDSELLNAIESRLLRSSRVRRESDYENSIFQFDRDGNGWDELLGLTQHLEIERFKMREHLFREGDIPLFLFFIRKGRVKLYRLLESGKEYILRIGSAGSFMGCQAIFEERRYAEYAQTLEACEIYRIPKHLFLGMLENNREFARTVEKSMAAALSQREDELAHLAYDSVRKRVATKILRLGLKTQDHSITLPRTDLAAFVGTSVETLVRTLAEIKNMGVIETDGHTIYLLDEEKLKRIQKYW